MPRVKKQFIEKICKICEIITKDEDEMNKFHGKLCRKCYNASRLEANKAHRLDNTDYHNVYSSIWCRERYRRLREEAGYKVKIRTFDIRSCKDLKVQHFRAQSVGA